MKRRLLLAAAFLVLAALAADPARAPSPAAAEGGEAPAACAAAVEEGSWVRLDEVDEAVLNATAAQLDEERLFALPPGDPDAWVPCAPEQRSVLDGVGCMQEAEDGSVAYLLQIHIHCLHDDHTDKAAFDAAVAMSADGDIQVNISAVHLEVDPSHAAAHSCSDPLCAECSPGGAPAEGSPPLPEVCHRCLLDYTPAKESGACVPPSEADVFGSGGGGAGLEDAAAAAKQPGGGGAAPEYSPPDFSVADCCSSGSQECCFGGGSGIGGPVRPAWWWQHCYQGPSDCRQIDPATAANPAKPCGVGWFLINQEPRNTWCARCSQPGCLDCVACSSGEGCRDGQFCIEPCAPGRIYRAGACPACSDILPGCAGCQRCVRTGDAAFDRMCHCGVQCLACKPGWAAAGDGTALCRPAGLVY